MKKSIILILVMLVVVASLCTVVSATPLGDAVYSDIVVYINHFPISSYTFDNRTLVVAEDLRNFGFDVQWDVENFCLRINRDLNKNTISEKLVFLPPANRVGTKSITVTDTAVKVFTGNYQYSSFGGVDGATLIDINDLQCIDNVSVHWVPEVRAVKIWVEDGLEMRTTPRAMRVMDPAHTLGAYCNAGIPIYAYADTQQDATSLKLFLTKKNIDGEYCNCTSGCVWIKDILDADGKSVYNKTGGEFCVAQNASYTPYYMGMTDFLCCVPFNVKSDYLYPQTAAQKNGSIIFGYACSCSNYTLFTEFKGLPIEQLPYGN